jgi:hypothetical protein
MSSSSSTTAAALKTWKIDASAEGCTGMFWRTKPLMSATSNDSSWPRNGALHKGTLSTEHQGWVHFENGFWLPTHQKGFQILFEQQ